MLPKHERRRTGPITRPVEPRGGPAPLSEEHRRELEEGSGISPEVIAARGYYTAHKPAELPATFPRWQRRPGLVVPGLSPSGARFHQYKPKTRIRRRSGPGPKYETPHGAGIFLDCNPLMLEEVRHGTGELWITEGCKKVDALASWGVPAVGLTGVHAAAVKGTKGTVPLACWYHVRLKGRTVIVAYDADAKTNASVQEGLRRVVAMLEALGAVVLVVYVPAVEDDSKAGVDDYKAAGLTLQGLRRRAHPYTPLDVGRERIKRDSQLRRGVTNLWRSWRQMPARSSADGTNRAVKRALITEAERTGKPERQGDREGLLVVLGARDGADDAGVSLGSWTNAIDRLVAAGDLRRAFWGKAKDKPGAYFLYTPWGGGRALGEHYGRGAAPEEGEGQEREVKDAESLPLSNGPDDRGVHSKRALRPSDEVPELRHPKTIFHWERKNGRRVLADYFYVPRLGKPRGEIIRYTLEAGGEASVSELLEEFGAKRARRRDFIARKIGPIVAAGIFRVEGDSVHLTDNWREALERRRREDQELEDARKQRERHAEQQRRRREAFRNPTPADPTPELAGPERTREIFAAAERRDHAARVEEQRRKVGITPETFIADALRGVSGFDWQRLGELWHARHGRREDLARVVRDPDTPYRFKRDEDGPLYVDRVGATVEAERDPAAVVPLNPDTVGTLEELENLRKPQIAAAPIPRNLKKPKAEKPPGDWRSHPLDCECVECVSPMPTYATAWSAS